MKNVEKNENKHRGLVLISGGFVAFVFLFGNMNHCFSKIDLLFYFGGFAVMIFAPVIVVLVQGRRNG